MLIIFLGKGGIIISKRILQTEICLIVTLLFACSGVFPSALTTLNISTTDSCDIPTWYIGDEWIYNADPVTYQSDNGSFIGKISNLKRKVIGISTITHGEDQIEVYEVEITGDIQGEMSWGVISGDLIGDIEGTSYIRMSDLAEVKTEIVSNGIVKILIINWNYELVNTNLFFPPLEVYDFPLKVDDQWEISCDISSSGYFKILGLMEEEFSDTEKYDEILKCMIKETVSVPAGDFESYKINFSSDFIWYSSEVGNIVKSEVDHGNRDYTFNMDLTLKSFSRGNQPIEITETIDPSEAIIDQEINISGQAVDSNSNPIQNGIISFEIPRIGQYWSTNTNDEGYYTITIDAPYLFDDTPSDGEFGSDGVIVSCLYNNQEGYRVKTLLIIDYLPPLPPDIDGPTRGKVGVEYDYNFVSTDPEAHDIYLYVDWGDDSNSGWKGPYSSGETITLGHTWNEKGSFTIRAKVREIIYGIESAWGFLDIKMPRNKILSNTFFQWLLERFPLISLLLQRI